MREANASARIVPPPAERSRRSTGLAGIAQTTGGPALADEATAQTAQRARRSTRKTRIAFSPEFFQARMISLPVPSYTRGQCTESWGGRASSHSPHRVLPPLPILPPPRTPAAATGRPQRKHAGPINTIRCLQDPHNGKVLSAAGGPGSAGGNCSSQHRQRSGASRSRKPPPTLPSPRLRIAASLPAVFLQRPAEKFRFRLPPGSAFFPPGNMAGHPLPGNEYPGPGRNAADSGILGPAGVRANSPVRPGSCLLPRLQCLIQFCSHVVTYGGVAQMARASDS